MKASFQDREQLVELLKRIPTQGLISMEAETYKGSGLEGINWDILKYVYRETGDVPPPSAWVDYTVVHRETPSADALLADFAELQRKGTGGAQSVVTVTYEEE